MTVNASKSNVVHFRPNSVSRTSSELKYGANSILITDKYTYLGITLNEFLDFTITAKTVAQSAGRALGLLIAKYKCIGGMTYDIFCKLYDTLVWPMISCGGSIFFLHKCRTKPSNEIFPGTGKYTRTAAGSGDMGWTPAFVRQWKCVCNHWNRMAYMDVGRVNK